jgi:Cu/Ag efflux protein CusF
MSIATKAIESPAPTQRYTLRGRVASLDKAGRTVTVDAEAIPGFMGAMMMSYPVKNERLLDHVSPSDHITATIVRVGDEYWLEDIETSKRNLTHPATRALTHANRVPARLPTRTLTGSDGF